VADVEAPDPSPRRLKARAARIGRRRGSGYALRGCSPWRETGFHMDPSRGGAMRFMLLSPAILCASCMQTDALIIGHAPSATGDSDADTAANVGDTDADTDTDTDTDSDTDTSDDGGF